MSIKLACGFAKGEDEGFKGYVEYDSGGHVDWFSSSGVYDMACLNDAAADGMRLQTFRESANQLAAFNYFAGPLTFEFDILLAVAPTAIRLTIGGRKWGQSSEPQSRLPR